jgi:hypothetical protein
MLRHDRYLAAFVILTPVFAILTYMLSAGFAATLWFLAMLRNLRGSRLRIGKVADKWVLAIWAWAALSSLWAPDMIAALKESGLLLAFATITIMAARARSWRDNERLLLTATTGFVFSAFIITIGFYAMYGGVRFHGMRETIVGIHGVRSASYFATAIPVAAYIIAVGRSRLGSAVLAAAIIGALLSQSRSGIAATMIALLMSYSLVGRDLRIRLGLAPIVLALAVIVGLLGIMIFPDILESDALRRLQGTNLGHYVGTNSESLSNRANVEDWQRRVMYAVGWENVGEFRVIGSGYYSTGFLVKERFGEFVPSHNLVVTVIGELGLIGGLIFGVFAYLVAHSSLSLLSSVRSVPDAVMFVRTLILVIALGLMISQYRPQTDNPLLWLALGLTLSAHAQLRSERRKMPKESSAVVQTTESLRSPRTTASTLCH